MCVCREGDVNPVDGEARTTLSLSLSPSVSLSRTHSVLGILEIVPPDITVYPPAFPPLFCVFFYTHGSIVGKGTCDYVRVILLNWADEWCMCVCVCMYCGLLLYCQLCMTYYILNVSIQEAKVQPLQTRHLKNIDTNIKHVRALTKPMRYEV